MNLKETVEVCIGLVHPAQNRKEWWVPEPTGMKCRFP